MSDDLYEAWIEQRRTAAPPEELPDRVMQLVTESQARQQRVVALRLASWIERSRMGRYAACGAATLVGSMPFVTYIAFLILV